MKLQSAMDLGRLIREARIDFGLSQASLASQLGSTQTWVSEIESGKPTAQVGLVLKVMAYLDISLDGKTKLQRDMLPADEIAEGEFEDYPDIDKIVGRTGP